MYSEPCARLTRFMMPNTSVSPAAIRNSMTPYCRPFSNCSKSRAMKNGDRPHFPKWGLSPFSPFHLAVLRVRILVLLEGLLQDAHLRAVRPRAFHRLQQVEVLDRMVIHVVGEPSADRVEVGLAHRLDQGVGVLQVAMGGPHRRVDQHDRVVALRAVEGRRVAEFPAEVGHVSLARRDLDVRAPEAR